jgi:hypothetical protein
MARYLLFIHRPHNRLPGYKATAQIICPEAVSLQNTVCHMPAQATLTPYKNLFIFRQFFKVLPQGIKRNG